MIESSVAYQYACDVREGKIITGRKIKLQVERFFEWLEEANQPDSEFYLDHLAGSMAVDFFPMFLNHTVGKMAGMPFHLAPFQAFTMYNVFGWKNRKTGFRRIRTVYDKRAKKNGKTAEMAGVALYCMSFDRESEAQVYVGATKEDQAKLCWKQAKQFIESAQASRAIQALGFSVKQRVIEFPRLGSAFMPLGGDSKTQDGINAHLSIIDEYHAHATDGVKENLESSSVNRSQPIVWHITTAGTNVASVCKLYEDTVIEVLEGRVKMDHLWIMMHDLDENDDWEDESNWVKANPLLGNGLSIERIREEYQNAKLQLSKVPNFKTKHLNMWVDAPQIWIPNEIWKQNKVSKIPDDAFKEGGYIGIDLSSTTDLTAVVAISKPDQDGNIYIVPKIFCPEDTIERRAKEDRVPYRFWRDKGYITSTPGNVIDYDFVKDVTINFYYERNIIRAGYDKWNAENFSQQLREQNVNAVEFSQSIGTMSAPTKEFERLAFAGKLKHDGNPVLEWMLASCVIYEDANENIKVHKGRSHSGGRRVDGIVATIIAIGESMTPDAVESKYAKPMNEIYI